MKDGNGLTALNVAENCGKTKCAQLIKEAAGKLSFSFSIFCDPVWTVLLLYQ